MKSLGKTIQIYCPSGEPRGVRIAEITTRIVQAVVVPRSQLEQGCGRPELCGVGLYFLFGKAEESETQSVYIGEAEDCAERLKQHNKSRDFWNIAVAIVSRTGSFTKAHAKLLEFIAIERAAAVGRYELENGNSGSEPTVPEWMAADVAEIFETAEVLLGALGFPIFDEYRRASGRNEIVFHFKKAGVQARGVFTSDEFVVLKGSTARMDESLASHHTVEPRRLKLLQSGVLSKTDFGYQFEKDWAFSTPSAAAAIVNGAAANGWTEWRDEKGRTLDDIYRRSKS